MRNFKIGLLAFLLAIVGVFGLQSSASANVWSPMEAAEDCTWNACIYITYEMAMDGTGMVLGSVEIFQNGGYGTVGHTLRCWNQDGVLKWAKYSSDGANLDLGGPDGSYHIWNLGQIWSSATVITCRYNFDAILYTGDVNDQYTRVAVANQY